MTATPLANPHGPNRRAATFPAARDPRVTEVHVHLHLPSAMAASAVLDAITALADRLHGGWEYRHPIGSPHGAFHVRVPAPETRHAVA